MVQKLEEYLFQEIGKRVRKARGKRSQKNMIIDISLHSNNISNNNKSNKSISINTLSIIENGKVLKDRNFMSKPTRMLLANYLTKGDQIKLLFGDTEEIRSLMNRLLYTLVLNGNKHIENYSPFEPFEAEYNKDYEEISNSIIKLMLFHPDFNKEFIEQFLNESINTDYLLERRKKLDEENKKIKSMMETNSGNFIKYLLKPTFDFDQFVNAFSFVVSNMLDQLLESFREKLQQLIERETLTETVKSYNNQSKQNESYNLEQKISSKINKMFKFENFAKLLVNQDIINLLNNIYIKQTFNKEKSAHYIAFISRYHIQNFLLSNLFENMETVRTNNTYQATPINKDLLHFYEDIFELTDYFLKQNKKAVPLHTPSFPHDVDISD